MRGIGIKTFQKLAGDRGHYGSVMIQKATSNGEADELFEQNKKSRISRTIDVAGDGSGASSMGEATLDVVAQSALFIEPDLVRFINSLAIFAMLSASDQLENDDGKECIAGAFELHTVKANVPTMHFYVFFRQHGESRIRRLHTCLVNQLLPGMVEIQELGVSVGQSGLIPPYSRRGPGGEPFLHGNKGDGPDGYDPNRDWQGYKVPITFPNTFQFKDYSDGETALSSHFDQCANISFSDLVNLLLEIERPNSEFSEQFRYAAKLQQNVGKLESFAQAREKSGDQILARVAAMALKLININTVYDIQQTKSAEFWRKFK